ncbi:MAG: M13 family metallopeptidase [Deltaproteobacteria bacterium]|nr:M13 family metallopeptidase [Deltaproteobacteria bacterium]
MFRTTLQINWKIAAVAALLAATSAQAGEVPGPAILPPSAYIDVKIPACWDFFGHATGAFVATPIPAERASYGVSEEMDERNWLVQKEILENAHRQRESSPWQERLAAFFASGMDTAAIAKAGLEPLAAIFKDIAGLKSADQLGAAIGRLHKLGIRPGFVVWVAADDKNSANNALQFFQGGLGLPERDDYLATDEAGKKLIRQYRDHVQKTLQLAGDATEVAAKNADAVLALETALAAASKTMVQLRDPEANYHKLTRAELQKLAPELDWPGYFAAVGVPASEGTLLVGQTEFIQALAKQSKQQPLATWQAYLRWTVLRAMASYGPPALDELDFAFYGKVLAGKTAQAPRWKRVLKAVDRALGDDLGRAYVERQFPPAAKQKVVEMIAFHKQALRQQVQALTWMGEATRKEALHKVDTLAAEVGYPDKWRDYSTMELKREAYLHNVLQGQAFEVRRQLAKLGKPVDKKEWYLAAQTNNAYYDPTTNTIVLTAGILQPPLLDLKASAATNYGGLASTIGHELMHMLDDQGSQYDAAGNLRTWWTKEDRAAYEKMTKQVVAQYDAYQALPELPVRGEQTLGENMADIAGLKMAFLALQLALPGKQVSDAQAREFFIAFAQSWRSNIRDEWLKVRIRADVHAPERFRVNGPVAALPAFAKAFACKPGEPMFAEGSRLFSIW